MPRTFSSYFLVRMSSSSWKKRARPMSRILTVPLRSTRMLPGLMSRWTRPAARGRAASPGPPGGCSGQARSDVHRPGLLDDLLQAGAVHVLHDEEVQLVVLVDVVGADDVGMVEGGDGAGLAVEAFQRRRGRRPWRSGSTLTATRRRISLCSHR